MEEGNNQLETIGCAEERERKRLAVLPALLKTKTRLADSLLFFSSSLCVFCRSVCRSVPLKWSLFSVPDNQICWGLGIQLSESEAKALQFRNSEWGPESNEAMIKEFENELCPWGGTMGDLIRDTPPELISKVFLEDKLFKTWFHGRTALIGDGKPEFARGRMTLCTLCCQC